APVPGLDWDQVPRFFPLSCRSSRPQASSLRRYAAGVLVRATGGGRSGGGSSSWRTGRGKQQREAAAERRHPDRPFGQAGLGERHVTAAAPGRHRLLHGGQGRGGAGPGPDQRRQPAPRTAPPREDRAAVLRGGVERPRAAGCERGGRGRAPRRQAEVVVGSLTPRLLRPMGDQRKSLEISQIRKTTSRTMITPAQRPTLKIPSTSSQPPTPSRSSRTIAAAGRPASDAARTPES